MIYICTCGCADLECNYYVTIDLEDAILKIVDYDEYFDDGFFRPMHLECWDNGELSKRINVYGEELNREIILNTAKEN